MVFSIPSDSDLGAGGSPISQPAEKGQGAISHSYVQKVTSNKNKKLSASEEGSFMTGRNSSFSELLRTAVTVFWEDFQSPEDLPTVPWRPTASESSPSPSGHLSCRSLCLNTHGSRRRK